MTYLHCSWDVLLGNIGDMLAGAITDACDLVGTEENKEYLLRINKWQVNGGILHIPEQQQQASHQLQTP